MSGLFGTILKEATSLADKFVMDKTAAATLAHEIATMGERHAQELAMAQIKVNEAEAKSGSIFIGGWRPFVGWTCGVALAYHFVGQPVIMFSVAMFGWELPTLPDFDMASLLTVLGGMLGLGSLRTFEKFKGVAKP